MTPPLTYLKTVSPQMDIFLFMVLNYGYIPLTYHLINKQRGIAMVIRQKPNSL